MTPISALIGVLFVGHSLFGKVNPQMLKQILQGQSQSIQVEAQIINGAPLKYNWSHSNNAEGVNARTELPKARYNAVILTEAIPLAKHLKWSRTSENALNFYELAVTANPDTQVYLQETWHSLNSGTGVTVKHDDNADTPWRDRIDQDLAKWQSVVDDVNAARSGDTPDMMLLPAGQAMAQLYDEIKAGSVPGVTDISDMFSDDIHPNHLGFYFLTMVQFGALTGQSPIGLPHQLKSKYGKPYDAPSTDLALRLQQIATQTIETHSGVTLQAIAPKPPEPAVSDPEPQAKPEPQSAPRALLPKPTGPVPMAIGLSPINDWSVQQPFLDVMKTARSWIGHKPGEWGGMTYDEFVAGGYLDENGWPKSKPAGLKSIGTMILTDLPEGATSLAGRYRLRYDGKGIVETGGRATNKSYGKNEVLFDFTPGRGSVQIRIQRTDRMNTGDYVRNITVVKLDNAAALDAGEIFNPTWIARINGFKALRFMDWMRTNHSKQSDWTTRSKVDDATYGRKGVPVEIMVELANQLNIDPWFNMPHLADDTYLTAFATLARDTLNPDLQAYVEFSNEVWNWQFAQTQWADEQARARWHTKGAWVQYYGLRAAETAQIWSGVYGDEAKARLINLISTQTGWLGLEKQILEAPLWEDHPIPAKSFDAYAIAGYFGRVLGTDDRTDMVKIWIRDSRNTAIQQANDQGLTGAAHDTYVDAHQYDAASALAGQELLDGSVSGDISGSLAQYLNKTLPYHADIAQKYGLDLIMYEGGSHVVGIGEIANDEELTQFYTHLNYTDEMGTLYTHLISGWHQAGGKLFNVFSDVARPSKWGSWGALRYLSDDNPRWDALMQFQ